MGEYTNKFEFICAYMGFSKHSVSGIVSVLFRDEIVSKTRAPNASNFMLQKKHGVG